MKRIVLLLILSFPILEADAQLYRRVIKYVCVETEKDMGHDDRELGTTRDTIVYQAFFDLENDSIHIKMGESALRIKLLRQSSHHYILQFFDRKSLMNTLKITLGKRHIRVNNDMYILAVAEELKCKFDVMTALNLLKDNLGDYPRDELELMNLNWGVPYYSYKIKSVTSYMNDPFGPLVFTYRAKCLYDKSNRLLKIDQEGRYKLSDIIYRAGKLQSYHVYYNQFDKMLEDYIYKRISDKEEMKIGSWVHVASGTEHCFTRTYTRIE